MNSFVGDYAVLTQCTTDIRTNAIKTDRITTARQVIGRRTVIIITAERFLGNNVDKLSVWNYLCAKIIKKLLLICDWISFRT